MIAVSDDPTTEASEGGLSDGESSDVEPAPAESAGASPAWWQQPPSWKRVAVAVVAALVLYYLVGLVQVVNTGRSDEAREVDAIVVLGAAQYDGRPSPQLAARLDHAVDLWERDLAPMIAVTGGKQPGDRFTEAETSRNYLVERGVPEGSIVLENEGSTTWESIDGVARLLGDGGEAEPEVLIVTDPYHSKRSELIADEVGLDPYVSPTPTSVVTGWESFRRDLLEAAGISVGRLIGFERLSDLTG